MFKSNNNCEEISTYILLFLVKIYIIKIILLLYLFKKQLSEIKKNVNEKTARNKIGKIMICY